MIQRTTIVSLLMLLGFTSAVMAEGSDPAAQVAPLIDNLTLAVVRVDVTTDTGEVLKWLEPGLTGAFIDPEDRDVAKMWMQKVTDMVDQWQAGFIKAGGKKGWLLVSLDAFPRSAFYVVIPVEPRADERALKAVLEAFTGPQGGPFQAVLRMGNNLVFTDNQAALERLREIKPVARPEIGKALAAEAGDAKIRVAIVPSDDARRVIEAVNPKLPNGTPTTVFTHGIQWAAVGIQPPPNGAAHAVVHSQNAQAAEALEALIRRLPENAPEDGGNAGRMTWRRILADAHLNGDQIALDLDEPAISKLGEQIGGALVRARTHAARLQSGSNVRQLLLVCIMYANDHKGQFPAALEEETKKQDLPAQMLVNPEHPNRRPGYVYIRPADGITSPSDRMVIYGAFKQWSGGTNVGFADGHCEWINDQPTFEKYLKDAQAHAAK
jgi:prepilin-type processing-associated H-X9-DG protein